MVSRMWDLSRAHYHYIIDYRYRFKSQLFVTIVNDWKLLIIVTKSLVLDVYGLLDPTLVITL